MGPTFQQGGEDRRTSGSDRSERSEGRLGRKRTRIVKQEGDAGAGKGGNHQETRLPGGQIDSQKEKR